MGVVDRYDWDLQHIIKREQFPQIDIYKPFPYRIEDSVFAKDTTDCVEDPPFKIEKGTVMRVTEIQKNGTLIVDKDDWHFQHIIKKMQLPNIGLYARFHRNTYKEFMMELSKECTNEETEPNDKKFQCVMDIINTFAQGYFAHCRHCDEELSVDHTTESDLKIVSTRCVYCTECKKRLKDCDRCSEMVTRRFYTYVEGERICDDCLSCFVRCYRCGNMCEPEDIASICFQCDREEEEERASQEADARWWHPSNPHRFGDNY